jgi:hypothetical protein
MASIRTPNPKPGEDTVIQIMVSPDFESQFNTLIAKLSEDITMEKTEP